MSELHLHASPELRRFLSRTPEEHLEAQKRTMATPLIANAINAHYGFEPPPGCEHIGVVTARIVSKLMADHISHHGVTPGLWKKA
ncbi:MAG: hypothetical protein K8F25_10370 [Fimbriimonadaceae bacterium]|nr:hypothetical protein [Alphaproteobacteria bacterium]